MSTYTMITVAFVTLAILGGGACNVGPGAGTGGGLDYFTTTGSGGDTAGGISTSSGASSSTSSGFTTSATSTSAATSTSGTAATSTSTSSG